LKNKSWIPAIKRLRLQLTCRNQKIPEDSEWKILKHQEKEISKKRKQLQVSRLLSVRDPPLGQRNSKFYASVTTITDGHKAKRTTAYASANARDEKSTNYGGSSITNFNTALPPQNHPKKTPRRKTSHERKQTDNNKNSRQKTQIL
jgi:hypothetical protein